MSWTDERVTTLKNLWLEGYSSSQIAHRLGEVSRNAVIGKLQRLNLLGTRRAASSPGAVAARKPVVSVGADGKSARNRQVNAQLRLVAPPAPPAPAKPAPRLAETPTATLVSLGRHACKWPIGHPGAADFGFCGRTAVGTYCDDHARVAYRPAPPRDKTVRPNHKLPLWARS